jgi:hypothetical protein
MPLDVSFRVGTIRHDFPTEPTGFQQSVMRDAGRDAFSAHDRRHIGALDDDLVLMLTVRNDRRLARTGSQFKALLAGKAERVITSSLLMAKPKWLGRNIMESKWMVWWDMGDGWLSVHRKIWNHGWTRMNTDQSNKTIKGQRLIA